MARLKLERKYLFAYILLFLGIAIILREYIGGRSLWVDEAMLALNMDRSFMDLARPLDYNQTAPLLFLFLSKFFTLLFGISDYSLRITPLLFGLGSLYLFFLISKRLFKPLPAAISMLLFITSYRLIYYANEFKHYSADVFFSLLFLYFFLLIKENGFDLRNWIVITIVGLVAIWFSFSAIIIVMLFAAVSLTWLIKQREKRGLIFFAASTVLWGLNILAEYVLVYLGNPNFSFEPLHDYWRGGFMPFPPTNIQDLFWLPKTIKDFFIYITNTDTILTGRFPVIIDIYAYVFIAFFLLGTIFLIKHKKIHVSVYGWGVILLALIASAAGVIPFGDRLVLYLVPLVLLVCAYGIYLTYGWVKKARKSLAIIFLVVLFFLPSIPKAYHLVEPTYKVELKSVINYYLENRKEEDKIYVYIDQDTYYPPQFYFYTGENFDFTNMEGSKKKDLQQLKGEILGHERVWTIGPLQGLEDYGQKLDSYSIQTLASRWSFDFLREDIVYLNQPNAEIKFYDFRQYELEDLIAHIYKHGGDIPNPEQQQLWVRRILTDPNEMYDLVLEALVEGNSGATDKEFVRAIYMGLLQREPDVGGLEYWLSELEAKVGRDKVAARIMDSAEFKAVMQRHGLLFD
ncbi:MAG: DUF4214 domain-containing protein [Actinomycetia bacterium]|nr:DUF4214 domain-containing protein [Actinomycetes bacterium]